MSRSWRLFKEVSADTHEQNSGVAVVVVTCQAAEATAWTAELERAAEQASVASHIRHCTFTGFAAGNIMRRLRCFRAETEGPHSRTR